MNTTRPFEQTLRAWLDAEAAASPPAELHAMAITAAGERTQRLGWLVDPLGAVIPYGLAIRPRVRYGRLLLVLALVLALLATAIVGAALLRVIPELPGKNGLIAFVVNDLPSRPYFHVHLINPDGSADRAIAEGSCPAYSGDGRRLVYLDQHRVGLSGVNSIVRVTDDAGFSSRRLLNVAGVVTPAISPDGTQMAWLKLAIGGGGSRELWVTPVSGGEGIRIAGLDAAPGQSLGAPIWSPDGESVAFIGTTVQMSNAVASYRSSIYVVGSDGANLRLLTSRPGVDRSVAWSPDGRYIAFAGVPDGQPAPSLDPDSLETPVTSAAQDVYVIGADGSGEHSVTNTADDERQPMWSPDGSRISFESVNGFGTWRLAKVELNGPNAMGPIAATEPPISGPFTHAWSPDGQRIVGLSGNPKTTAFPDESPTTLWSIAASLQGQASTLYTKTSVIGWSDPCPPSWQWLAP